MYCQNNNTQKMLIVIYVKIRIIKKAFKNSTALKQYRIRHILQLFYLKKVYIHYHYFLKNVYTTE